MALVILSAESMTRSKTRTVSVKAFLGCLLGGMAMVLAGGVWLGYGFSRVVLEGSDGPIGSAHALEVNPVAMVEVRVAPPPAEDKPFALGSGFTLPAESRHLVERFGELSGRMIQLETEALELATRIGVIEEFEERIRPDETNDVPLGREARTPPGSPSGGPMLRPVEGADQGNARTTDSDVRDLFNAPLTDDLIRIEQNIERLADVFAELDSLATAMNHAHMAFPGRKPVHQVAITSGFGNRIDPFSRRRAFHSGVDFPAPRGTPIYASAGGKVIYAANRRHYGLTVEVDHGAGLVTRYAHASKLLVKKGEVVMPGQEIARIGSTGRSTGPHLHFEILKDGHFVDPSIYLARF